MTVLRRNLVIRSRLIKFVQKCTFEFIESVSVFGAPLVFSLRRAYRYAPTYSPSISNRGPDARPTHRPSRGDTFQIDTEEKRKGVQLTIDLYVSVYIINSFRRSRSR